MPGLSLPSFKPIIAVNHASPTTGIIPLLDLGRASVPLSVKFSVKLKIRQIGLCYCGDYEKNINKCYLGYFCLFVYVKARSSNSGGSSSRPLNNYLLAFI